MQIDTKDLQKSKGLIPILFVCMKNLAQNRQNVTRVKLKKSNKQIFYGHNVRFTVINNPPRCTAWLPICVFALSDSILFVVYFGCQHILYSHEYTSFANTNKYKIHGDAGECVLMEINMNN